MPCGSRLGRRRRGRHLVRLRRRTASTPHAHARRRRLRAGHVPADRRAGHRGRRALGPPGAGRGRRDRRAARPDHARGDSTATRSCCTTGRRAIGAIYDWTGEGRSRLFAHWGRYYESIPLDLNSRGFGGEVIDVAILDQTGELTGSAGCGDPMQPASYDCDPAGLSAACSWAATGWSRPAHAASTWTRWWLGVEYEVLRDLKVGLVGIHRGLGRALEDISPDGGSTFVVGNPGEVDEEAVRDLRAQAMAAEDPATAARLGFLAGPTRRSATFDSAKRTYQALELSAVKFFSRCVHGARLVHAVATARQLPRAVLARHRSARPELHLDVRPARADGEPLRARCPPTAPTRSRPRATISWR